MEFEIAKKLEKLPAKLKGNSLRSIKADRSGATMIIVADAYGDIKTGVENFRMATNADISFRMRGKSIDITVLAADEIVPGTSAETTLRRRARADSALNVLMEFAKTLSFNSEDAVDAIEFWNGSMPLEGCDFVEMDMDQSRMRITMHADSLDAAAQEAVMQKLDGYNMGILK